MPKKSPSTASKIFGFQGFSKGTFVFLRELAKNNDRDWFATNRLRYESEIVAPTMAFIEAMQPHLRKISPYLLAVPKRMGGSMMRIYRDTRFSKNKLPYKTNVGIHFRHELGGDVHAPGYYVHLESGGCFLGAGMWMPEPDSLGKIRELIVEDSRYWQRTRDDKKFTARYKFEGEALKKAPRGYDPLHPMINDLRRKCFAGLAQVSEQELMNGDCVEKITRAFRDAKPLMKFLCDALDQPF
jgi:uncharacterized protein (TIGR02453 family)